MYCNQETKDLAIAKGYTQCTCGIGYPMCICEKYIYSPIRLDDIARWLREKLIDITIECGLDSNKKTAYKSVVYCDWLKEDSDDGIIFNEYDKALEDAINDGLKLI